ncbi:MAG: MinD/ParA family protein [Methylophilaceae bacterium]
MAKPEPRIISVLSASPEEGQSILLTNLAATICENGSDVLVLHAGQDSIESSRNYGINALPTLLDVAEKRSLITQSIKNTKLGFATIKLQSKNQNLAPIDSAVDAKISEIFNDLANRYTLVLADVALNKNNVLPLSTLSEGKILIQMTRDPESVKKAYILIKHICNQHGRRSIGIIVTETGNAHAAVVFRNIAQIVRRFLAIDLEFFGAIPADEHITRAAKLGRSVTDAFPRVAASISFKGLAQRLNYQQNRSTNVEQKSLA